MKRCSAILVFVMLCFGASLVCAEEFDPALDGWYFVNWGESGANCIGSCDLSWDLYRQAYLGINPTHDCVEAPLDCAFYEVFKNCGQGGNCGGMSLLALALFKYGGYMGFCSPASFYTGGVAPDREDLHRAINILQARQFSLAGIENIIDLVDAGDMNDAQAAFYKVSDCLARGDYAVLSIANSTFGDVAHTVIPYKAVDGPSGGFPKTLHIWDPNLPYDDNSSRYTGGTDVMTINSPTDWTYVQSSTRTYSGSGGSGAWCFAVPMSVILPKSRQPFALDLVFDALMSAFITGPGAAVTQISDDQGRQLYKTDADLHMSRTDLETDPNKRLKGAMRWPWFAQVDSRGAAGEPGELYFVRRAPGTTRALNFSISGTQYKAVVGVGGNLVQIDASSSGKAKDIITVSGLATAAQSVEIKTLGAQRSFDVRQLRGSTATRDWRSVEVKGLEVTRDAPVVIESIGDMEAVVVSSRDKAVSFNLDLKQRVNGKFSSAKSEMLSTTPGKLLKVVPGNWRSLGTTTLDTVEMEKTLAPVPAEVR